MRRSKFAHGVKLMQFRPNSLSIAYICVCFKFFSGCVVHCFGLIALIGSPVGIPTVGTRVVDCNTGFSFAHLLCSSMHLVVLVSVKLSQKCIICYFTEGFASIRKAYVLGVC